MSMPTAPLEQHSLGMVSSLLDEEVEEDRAGGALALQSNKPEILSNSNEFLNANDPCKSNDGADYTALTQSMFGEDAGVLVKVNHVPCIVQKDDDDEEGVTANGTDGAAGNGGGTAEGDTPTDGTEGEATDGTGVNGDGSTEGNGEDGSNSSPLDGDDTTPEGSDNGEEGGNGSDSTGDGKGDGTGSGSAGGSDGTEGAADKLQSFYSCSPNSSSANTPPSNSKEVTLTYDYELHTSSPLNDDILSKLEDSITNDIANKYGLVTCSSIQEERRHLRASSYKQQRSLQAGDLLAVGSNPEDESLSDQCKLFIVYLFFSCLCFTVYAVIFAHISSLFLINIDECEVQVQLAEGQDSTCTPIRGYMTAWIPDSSTADDTTQVESELLSFIENGMISDMYVSDDVVKVAYVGDREDDVDDGSPQDGADDADTQDGGTTGGSDISDSTGDADNSSNTAGSGSSGNTDLVVTSPSDPSSKEDLAVDNSKSSQELEASENGPPLLAIGLSLFFVAFALAIVFGVYVRRKRRNRRYFSDGPNESNIAAQALEVDVEQPPADPDDMQLLPSPDKMDMRSVFSSEQDVAELETENYESKYGDLYGGSYGDGGKDMLQTVQTAPTEDYTNIESTPTKETSNVSKYSGLAAMGAASKFVASTPSRSLEEDDEEDNVSQPSVPSRGSSHVGTVEECTPGAGNDYDSHDASSVGEQSMEESHGSTFNSDSAWA